jgi:GT2 family glycosyltransferase
MTKLGGVDGGIAAEQEEALPPDSIGSPVLVESSNQVIAGPINLAVKTDIDRSSAPHETPTATLSSVVTTGNLERADHDELSGWAWDPARPDEPVDIEILDDDVVVLTLAADEFRLDLSEAAIGDGRHGFRVRNLTGVFPLSRHRVRVRRASDGRDLVGSPHWITRMQLDDQALAFIDGVIASSIQVSTKADDLIRPLGHLVRLLADVTNAHAALAKKGQRQSLPAVAHAAGVNLNGRAREFVLSLQTTYPPLHFEPAQQPLVSVIIPVHNRFRHTYDCLRSIRDAISESSFEIILVDDGSSDETLFCALVFVGAVRVLRNPDNVGFVPSCNAGAASASGRYLLFLNNDTVVRPGWLDELVGTFEHVPNVGIAGSKLLFADGTLQQSGGIVSRLGDTLHWGSGLNPFDPRFCFLRDVDYVSSTALMIEQALFHESGGFDELFAPAFYEDVDLAFRVRALGRRVVMQPASEIIHYQTGTECADPDDTRAQRYHAANHGKFYQRWKKTLVTHRLSGDQPEGESERYVDKRAYFIDDAVPTPDQDAESAAALDHMRQLMQFGYKVTFLPGDDMARVDPYTENLQKVGVDCRYQPFSSSVEEVFRTTLVTPDLVYLRRYGNAAKYATMVRSYFPRCRIICGVANLQFVIMQRRADFEHGTVGKLVAATQRQLELAAMREVNWVIVHSLVEAKILEEADPELQVSVVPWTVQPRPTSLAFHDRSGIAYVGSFGQSPNVDAAHYLSSEILPLLRDRVPKCRVYLVGSDMPDEIMNLRQPGLVPLGYLATLPDLLHGLRCTIAPLRYGAGIKGMVLESFAHGLPCVMSEIAAEGLQLPSDLAWLVAREPNDYAEKIGRLHDDAAYNARLSEVGLTYITQRCSEPVVKAALQSALG